MTQTEPVVLRSVDARGVATVTLNRPRVNNAYNGDLIVALLDAFSALAADDSVRLVVLRGNGRHFQAGADLKWIDGVREGTEAENLAVSRRTAEAVRGLNEFPKPVVALVHGGCFGGGIGMIAACDVVIAEDSAVFAITEARWGLVASVIVPQLLGAMGLRQVRRYALSCERFDAERARACGLVHEVCPAGGLDAAAAPVIDAFLASAPGAVAETKALALAHAGQVMDDDYFERLVQTHSAKRMTPEAREGLASFKEKRPPAWYPGAI
jgi:methylglutaconyl-CoA hydratase